MRYTNEQQIEALVQASKICKLHAHITTFQRKSDLQTWADRIIGIFYRKHMPIKRSYMMCSTLDMDFFFTKDGEAVYTYAGYADNRDATEEKIVNAFRMANRMREEMQKAIQKYE